MRWNPLGRHFGYTAAALLLAARFTSTASAAALPPSDPSAALFTNGAIPRLEIEIAPDAYTRLAAYRFDRAARHEDREDVPATVRSGGQTYTNVGIHVKGGLGSFRPLDDDQVSLTLNFGKFTSGQRFHGLKKLSLNSSLQDGSFLSEKLGRELYAAAGIPVPRADYALVRLNDRELGLRVLTEGWDKTFLKKYFTNADGPLFDNGPTGRDVGDRDLQVGSGDDPPDFSAVTNLVRATKVTNVTARLTALEQAMDADRLLSLYCVDTLAWNWDGFLFNRNNWRAYAEPPTGRLTFMPHGLDQLFWQADPPIVPQPKCLPARALMEIPGQRERYLARLRELRTNLFDLTALSNRAAQVSARLRPAFAAIGMSPLYQQRQTRVLLRRAAERLSSVDAQLASIESFRPLGTNWASLATIGTPWKQGSARGGAFPSLDVDTPDHQFHLSVTSDVGVSWVSKTVWLEAGKYTLEGRVKTGGLAPADPDDPWQGAGLSAWSYRKRTLGTSWGWFPFAASRELDKRGELIATNAVPVRLQGDSEWRTIRHDFELRTPLADIELRGVVQRAAGEAWFDLDSLRLRRRGK